ncbi:MAG: TonB-dependent receptor [Bacteroidetes bacterium]|nr:TonB-dependent receptor [Bacteroidota bacterium]
MKNKQHKIKELINHNRLIRLMMITIIISASSINIFAQTNTEVTKTVKLTNVTVQQLIDKLSSEFKYSFFIVDDQIPNNIVSVDVKNATINEILDNAFLNKEIGYSIKNNNITISSKKAVQKSNAPAKKISGTITDDKGEPLIGASVKVKGTDIGSITNVNGNFSVDASDQSTLLISYIGFIPSEIKVGSQTNIAVKLVENTKSLEEVVVVGYGVQKKSVVTGAIASVRAKDMEGMVIPRVEDALKGRTAGVTVASSSGAPGTASTVMVRGITSINNREPLYVVDGVAMTGGLDQINKSDIQSIEVLKDAASAAIYGTASAAGVILVTTKKGTAGVMKVSLNSMYGVQSRERKLDLLNASEYAALRNESTINAGGVALFSDPASLGAGTDWQSEVFNNSAPIQNHELSITGGGEKSTFFTSVGYYDQTGIIASEVSGYRRLSFRLNTDHKVKKWLNIGTSFTYTNSKSKTNVAENDYYGNVLNSAISLDPITPTIYSNKDEVMPNAYAVKNDDGYYYGISKYVGQEMINPLAFIQVNKNNSYNYSNNFNGNFYVQIEPMKGLQFRSQLGGKMSFWGSEKYDPLHFYSSTQMNTSKNSYTRERSQGLNWTFTNTVSYNTKLNDNAFSVLLGTEIRDENSTGASVVYYAIPASNLKESSMNISVSKENVTGWGYESQPYRLLSYFGRVNYDYMNKYVFTGIVRRDGSTRFGSNNRFGNFPSASIRWNVQNENFWKKNNICDGLDIRLGYGVNGSDRFDNFKFISLMQNVGGAMFGDDQVYFGSAPSSPANADLKWEKTTQLNFGVDATLFRNLSVTLDIYRKATSDMLMIKKIPGYVGATNNPYSNLASMVNNGIELNLTYNKQFNKDLNFTASGNIAYNVSEITKLSENKYETLASMQASNYEVERMMVGKPYGMFWGFKTDGIFQTQEEIDAYLNMDGKKIQPNAKPGDFKWQDLDGDGSITEADRDNIGLAIAPVTFGLTLKAEYKNWDATVFGQGVTGNKICNQIRRLDVPTSNYLRSALGRWVGEGTSNTYPRLTNSDTNGNFTNMSDFYLEDGAYVRLKTLQIGYTLPKALVNKISIEKLRVYATGNNLFTVTKYSGYDPEIGGNQGIYGIDRGVYPQARSFMLGVDLTF